MAEGRQDPRASPSAPRETPPKEAGRDTPQVAPLSATTEWRRTTGGEKMRLPGCAVNRAARDPWRWLLSERDESFRTTLRTRSVPGAGNQLPVNKPSRRVYPTTRDAFLRARCRPRTRARGETMRDCRLRHLHGGPAT